MKNTLYETASHAGPGEDLEISMPALLELMRAVHAKGGDFRFTASGISMAPFIKSGDEITIRALAAEKPTLGKVVAYIRSSSGSLIIHRIIANAGNAYIIRGDNAIGRDAERVEAGAILGCVVRIERNGRRVIFGLGPERYLVAYLARNGYLETILSWLRGIKHHSPD